MMDIQTIVYLACIILAVIVGLSAGGAVFFFGVGYVPTAGLMVGVIATYLGTVILLAQGAVTVFQPTEPLLLATNILLALIALPAGFLLGRQGIG